jgi:hypothetical protein
LLQEGLRPVCVVVGLCSEAEADDQERRLIEAHQLRGRDLTNCTEGGGGTRGHRHSDEAKAKIGAAHRGKIVSEETRRRLSEARLGTKLSAEARARLRGRAGHPMSEEARKRTSERMLGNRHGAKASRTPEWRAAMSRMRGGNHSQAAFSDAEVADIRRRVASGEKQYMIAEEKGVSRPCISRIVNNRTY